MIFIKLDFQILSFRSFFTTIMHFISKIFTAALALRSRGLVIGSREKEEREREKEEEEKNLQIAIRCLWDLFD